MPPTTTTLSTSSQNKWKQQYTPVGVVSSKQRQPQHPQSKETAKSNRGGREKDCNVGWVPADTSDWRRNGSG
ncbi:hypothetical protein Taro_020589 [Colocasia esculenta]|uniref:Uncharacterized protein n=1 Tax=Colocasia esculenta TaxID=4460 RepID=A0A843V5N1_COLES|nr:hypothetical protein [Colocasia esculenta]